jgi:hypothetical protein
MVVTSNPARVGLPLSAYFRIHRVAGRRYWLERLEAPNPANVRVIDHPWPRGAQVEVRISVYESDGRLFVGNVQIITAPEPIETPYGLLVPPQVEPLPVGADLLRLIPIGLLADEAIQAEAADAPHSHDLDHDPDARARLDAAVSADGADRPRRGRKPKLSPEQLELVARAYRAGGRSGVRSVQRALTEDPRFDGEATWDQAAKAVSRARNLGLIPPTGRKAAANEH